jgi:uncharacterized protein (DUF1697 family)
MGANRTAERVHVALLRGVNVGGRNRLPMADLSALFEEAGGREVRTHLQSGNVVFRAGAARAPRLAEAVAREIEERLGFRPPMVMRTAGELAAAARGNPFLRPGADLATLHVAFLADRPSAARVTGLDPERSPPDELAVRGREVYLRLPNGVARTRITNAWLDTALGTTSTLRNWRTVLALVGMATEE